MTELQPDDKEKGRLAWERLQREKSHRKWFRRRLKLIAWYCTLSGGAILFLLQLIKTLHDLGWLRW